MCSVYWKIEKSYIAQTNAACDSHVFLVSMKVHQGKYRSQYMNISIGLDCLRNSCEGDAKISWPCKGGEGEEFQMGHY